MTQRKPGPACRPMPEDFHEVAKGKTINQLQAIYSCGANAVKRWREAVGIPTGAPIACKRHQPAKRKMPDGFALVARNMTMRGLRTHFKASAIQVNRWCDEAGVTPRKAGQWRQPGPRPLPDHRDNSRAGLAAQYLQRFGPVVRCNEDGRLNADGTHWLRGGRFILTDDEIIARAERNGWQPDAWKAIAA